MTEPWPCSACGAPGARNLGTRGYCTGHLEQLMEPIREAVARRDGADTIGIARRNGLTRPEHGLGMCDVKCDTCGATWVGQPGDPCGWCIDEVQRQRAERRRLALTPPDTDSDDERYEARMIAWAERLRRSVDAGVIDRDEAERAWSRAVRKAAA